MYKINLVAMDMSVSSFELVNPKRGDLGNVDDSA
jgi:hypothetical protein